MATLRLLLLVMLVGSALLAQQLEETPQTSALQDITAQLVPKIKQLVPQILTKKKQVRLSAKLALLATLVLLQLRLSAVRITTVLQVKTQQLNALMESILNF